ncbi:MAG: homoserine/homoserine lactone efflux protein [Candidatus Endobugula sp.]|jgi:threonine/homoserine/homoserine lactone efflux protein
MNIDIWLGFLAIAIIATITPGPAILLVITHSLASGWVKTLLTIWGNISGLFLMSLCSVLGLSALVIHSSVAFLMIKLLGAMYLFYLGLMLWRNGIQLPLNATGEKLTERKRGYYFQGILVSLTNPKAIVFTTALFPQFISTQQALLPQFSILVATLITCSALCLLAYAYWGEKLLRGSTRALSSQWLPRAFGSTFMGAGIALVFSTQK